MRNYLVVDTSRERACEYLKELNKPKEMENYVEYQDEAILYFEDRKYFITNQIPRLIESLSLHGIHLHRETKLTQKDEESIRNAMIKTYGLDGVDPELPHIHTY